jgi:hypothetical protein
MLLLAAATQLAGCALGIPTQSIQFRAVDAATGAPIPGVRAVRTCWSATVMTLVLFGGKDGSFDLPTTDTNGRVTAGDLHTNQNHSVEFSKSGYIDTSATYYPSSHKMMLPLPPTDPHHERSSRNVAARGIIDVPMYRQGGPAARYEPAWRRASAVPDLIIAVAEEARQSAPNARLPAKEGEMQRYALVNQYGDYQLIWVWRDPKVPVYRGELVEVTPPQNVARTCAVSSPVSAGVPTPEEISGRAQ